MAVLTLTTDWGTSDYYVAALKGQLLQACPDVQTIDISHHIKPCNMSHAAFVVGKAYRFFPRGSIHFVGVDFVATAEAPMVAAYADGHYFIWTNNDWLSFVAPHFEQVVELAEQPVGSFAELGVVPAVVGALLQPDGLQTLGRSVALKQSLPRNPVIKEDSILTHVLHIDHYGNVITNLTRAAFDAECHNRPYTIYLGTLKYCISTINNTYGDVPLGYPVAFFNHCDLLEIAYVQGNVAKLYKLSRESTIIIRFKKAEQ
jgi:S-adenosylmethionine hydrolase